MNVPWDSRSGRSAGARRATGRNSGGGIRGRDFWRPTHLYRRNPPVAWDTHGACSACAYDTARLEGPSGGDWLASRAAALPRNGDARLRRASPTEPMPWFFNVEFRRSSSAAAAASRPTGPSRPSPATDDHPTEAPSIASRRRAPAPLVSRDEERARPPNRGPRPARSSIRPSCRFPTPGDGDLTPNADGRHELRHSAAGRGITRVLSFLPRRHGAGWKGTLAPSHSLNVRDIRPSRAGNFRLPPPARDVRDHLPPAPAQERRHDERAWCLLCLNIDYVLFGSLGWLRFSAQRASTRHADAAPQNIHHGPQPGAAERAATNTRTEEVAVALDTKNPLRPVVDRDPSKGSGRLEEPPGNDTRQSPAGMTVSLTRLPSQPGGDRGLCCWRLASRASPPSPGPIDSLRTGRCAVSQPQVHPGAHGVHSSTRTARRSVHGLARARRRAGVRQAVAEVPGAEAAPPAVTLPATGATPAVRGIGGGLIYFLVDAAAEKDRCESFGFVDLGIRSRPSSRRASSPSTIRRQRREGTRRCGALFLLGTCLRLHRGPLFRYPWDEEASRPVPPLACGPSVSRSTKRTGEEPDQRVHR